LQYIDPTAPCSGPSSNPCASLPINAPIFSLGHSIEDIKDHSRSGHPTTPADTIAAKKGYRVVRVTISPTH
jgi:hypothetical protein